MSFSVYGGGMEMAPYKSRPIKRKRRTSGEIANMKAAMYLLAHEHKPLTIRNLFYLMVSQGAIEKTEAEYKNVVVRLCSQLRESGELPFDWIVDSTRWMRKQPSYYDLDDMLEQSVRLYRRDLWRDQPYYFEVWCESDSIAGILYDVTDPWDIPLMSCRGFPSMTFLHSSITQYREIEKPVKLLYFGDYDPSGMAVDRQIQKAINNYAKGADVDFNRCAVTEEWIEVYNLPTKPAKLKDTRSKNWKGGTVEIEAIPPKELKAVLNYLIEQLIDPEALKKVKLTEKAERDTLMTFKKSLQKEG